jgi:hypothetical protein
MAKAAKTVPAASAAAPAAAPASTAYTITLGDAPPPAAAFGGGRRGEDNPIKTTMAAMAAPAGGKYASFSIPVTVADSITDPAEKQKALSDKLRKEVAKVSGVARRITKADASAHFTIRGVKDEQGNASVRVWRVEPKAAPAA